MATYDVSIRGSAGVSRRGKADIVRTEAHFMNRQSGSGTQLEFEILKEGRRGTFRFFRNIR